MLCTLLFTGCEKVNVGDYKEGTYFGTYVDTTATSPSVSTAVVYVDSNGLIKSVFLDNTYSKNNTLTTKKTLGNDYAMKVNSEVGKEWYEQVAAFEEYAVGKTVAEVLATPTTGSEDLKTSVTIDLSGFLSVVEKAASAAVEVK